GQNLQMKFCFRSLQLLVHSVDVTSSHLLVIPSTLLMCKGKSVEYASNLKHITDVFDSTIGWTPEKEILRNSLRSYPLTSTVELSG
ncbi:hypothetical protein Tco_1053083, partial [Tanacetum coccineum]